MDGGMRDDDESDWTAACLLTSRVTKFEAWRPGFLSDFCNWESPTNVTDMTIRSDILMGKTRDSVVIKGREHDATWVTCLFCYAWCHNLWDDGTLNIQASKQKVVWKRYGFQCPPCRKGSIAEAHTAVAVAGCLRTCTFQTQLDLLSRQGESLLGGVMVLLLSWLVWFCQYGKLAKRKLFL